jgi:predicted TIM-barrel fold metal-dependent hydrolase
VSFLFHGKFAKQRFRFQQKDDAMNRRDFMKAGFLAGAGLSLAETTGQSADKPHPPVIDAHCHAGKGFNYGKTDPSLPAYTTYNDPQWTLDRMQEVGIDQTVIFPIANTTYADANKEIASYVRRWPDKFIGFAKHDAKTEVGKIRDLLRYEVRELGLKGLKLHGVPSEEMVAAAAELNIPILFHPLTVGESLEVVRSHPEVSFVLAHLGCFASKDSKEHSRAIEAAKQLPNLYLETSSVVFVNFLEQAARELPAEKLIFGSDGPLVDSRVELYKIRLLKLPRQKEDLVLGGNIRRLLGLRA